MGLRVAKVVVGDIDPGRSDRADAHITNVELIAEIAVGREPTKSL